MGNRRARYRQFNRRSQRLQRMQVRFSRCALVLASYCSAASIARADTGEVMAESMASDSIRIASAAAAWSVETSRHSGRLNLSVVRFDIDYLPSELSPDQTATGRSENRIELSGELWSLPENYMQFGLSGGISNGFADANQVWLDEFYRQRWAGLDFPGDAYNDPSPGGFSVGAGFKWEYRPANALLDIRVGFAREEIAPGYQPEFDGVAGTFLERGIDTIEVWTLSVTSENNLSPSVRVSNTLRLTDTTDRDIRLSWNGSANYAVTQRLFLRLNAAFVHENPQFRARSASLSFAWAITPAWEVSVSARYYDDTGQIEQANLATNAAPDLTTRALTAGLRWRNATENRVFSINAGPYSTRYGTIGFGNFDFEGLYSDRNWLLLRAAYSHTF